jgi:hypothetical protein
VGQLSKFGYHRTSSSLVVFALHIAGRWERHAANFSEWFNSDAR